MKHKSKLCENVGIQQWGVNYWETYAPVVNWRHLRSLSPISSIHEFPSISIEFVLAFPQSDLDVDVFMGLLLLMLVDENRVEWS